MAITYMNGGQLIDFASSVSQQVSGMSAAEATATLGGKVYNTNGLTTIYTFPGAVTTGGKPVTLEAQYAAQMWNYWKITGGAAVSAIGTAAAGATSWAQGVLFGNPELAGTLAGSGGLLTMSLPTAATLMIPFLGASIGANLYNAAPDVWQKISETLLPFAYDDKDTIAFVVDKLGQVYAPKAAIEALKQLFENEGYGSSANVTQPLSGFQPFSFVYKTRIQYYAGNYYHNLGTSCAVCYASKTESVTSFVIAARSTSASGYSSYTLDGKTVYYRTYETNSVPQGIPPQPNNVYYANYNKIAWMMLYGGVAASYPDGISNWTGNSVDVSQLTPIQVVSGMDGSTTPYIPVTLPVGDPTVTNDPSVQPDPTAPVTAPQLDPYISPVTFPELWPTFPEEVPIIEPGAKVGPQASSDPLYVPAPDLNPNNDPTVIGDVQPAEELNTNQSNPVSGGQSPDPIFPVPDVPFPSWMPAGSDTPVPSGQPGFIQVYHPHPNKFIEFGRWLWVTYADATIDKIWNNPFDGVIGAHELYTSPADDGYSTIRCGFLDSGIETQIVRQRYTQINCGSMVIPEYWGNYLDYSPYSEAMIYLPFIGIVPLDVDDIVGHAVNVLYHVDSYTGSCIAQVTVARENYSNTLYQFSGNCSVEIPLAGASQAQIKAALMTGNAYQNAANVGAKAALAGGIGSGITSLIGGGIMQAAGNPIGLGMGAASGVQSLIGGFSSYASQKAYGEANHTANMLSGKSIVQHSGSFGASHGAMGIKKPYIIIRRPIQKIVNGYQKLYGYPAHKQVIIGSCTGYLRCREVHVVSSLATDAEKNQIESLLKGGVYVTEQ